MGSAFTSRSPQRQRHSPHRLDQLLVTRLAIPAQSFPRPRVAQQEVTGRRGDPPLGTLRGYLTAALEAYQPSVRFGYLDCGSGLWAAATNGSISLYASTNLTLGSALPVVFAAARMAATILSVLSSFMCRPPWLAGGEGSTLSQRETTVTPSTCFEAETVARAFATQNSVLWHKVELTYR